MDCFYLDQERGVETVKRCEVLKKKLSSERHQTDTERELNKDMNRKNTRHMLHEHPDISVCDEHRDERQAVGVTGIEASVWFQLCRELLQQHCFRALMGNTLLLWCLMAFDYATTPIFLRDYLKSEHYFSIEVSAVFFIFLLGQVGNAVTQIGIGLYPGSVDMVYLVRYNLLALILIKALSYFIFDFISKEYFILFAFLSAAGYGVLFTAYEIMVAEVILYAEYAHENRLNNEVKMSEDIEGVSGQDVSYYKDTETEREREKEKETDNMTRDIPETVCLKSKDKYENIVYGFNDCARELGLSVSYLVNGFILDYLNTDSGELVPGEDPQLGSKVSYCLIPIFLLVLLLAINVLYPRLSLARFVEK
eukprot:CAMPEP_0182439170 /NCGR_PEP_ID=MMETSP1167-20130531/86273_1 /TAXON_ID=2988 /ORGANISM="Mallomonas Sp, Strain CCMP3275" /LENGTH=364 /DNA_ID=CAMNT_0024632809 /DNA_START=860 /DNA_END=1954 /DNA_ORIENTATION=-